MRTGLYTYEENKLLRSVIRAIVYIVVIISFAWFLVYGFMGQTIISGQSMSPILNAGDQCLINRLKYDLLDPDRFDIVLFEREDTSKDNVKVVVGLPGETVEIRNGFLYIDGELLEGDLIGRISVAGLAENAIELGDDEYFVMGTNTESSEDSRFSSVGNVKRDSIKGCLWFKIRSDSGIGFINYG